MDLVGVSSPEPGPSAAWGPSKVSSGRGTRGMLVSEAGQTPRQAKGTAPGGRDSGWVCACRLHLSPAVSRPPRT